MSIERLIQLQIRQNELQEATLLEMREMHATLRGVFANQDLEDEWLDNADLKRLFNICASTIWRWRTAKKLPFKKAGRKLVYSKNAILKLREYKD